MTKFLFLKIKYLINSKVALNVNFFAYKLLQMQTWQTSTLLFKELFYFASWEWLLYGKILPEMQVVFRKLVKAMKEQKQVA